MKIYCQAKKKSKIGSDLDNHTLPCMEALAQLYLFGNRNSDFKHHWASEVWNHFRAIDRLKKTNKFPSADFIYEHTWKLNENRVQIALDKAVLHERNLTVDKDKYEDLDLATEIMQNYFGWMSESLSENGRLNFSEVKAELAFLGIY